MPKTPDPTWVLVDEEKSWDVAFQEHDGNEKVGVRIEFPSTNTGKNDAQMIADLLNRFGAKPGTV